MKAVFCTMPDGSLSIIRPSPELFDPTSRTRVELRALNIDFADEQAIIDWLVQKDGPIGATFVRVGEETEILPDRTFRNAWEDIGVVDVAMLKARALHRERLRKLRAPRMAILDAEYMQALERNDVATMAEIATQRQALRDVTADPAIEAATTPEALKRVIPQILRVT